MSTASQEVVRQAMRAFEAEALVLQSGD
jgi:hypothetical protein